MSAVKKGRAWIDEGPARALTYRHAADGIGGRPVGHMLHVTSGIRDGVGFDNKGGKPPGRRSIR